MHIVHYVRAVRLADGGVVRAVLDLCQAFALRGHRVTLLTFDACDAPQSWNQGATPNPRVVELPSAVLPRLFLSRQAHATVSNLMNTTSVLHLHVVWDPACLPLTRLARRRATSYVVTLHGMLDTWSLAQKHWKKKLHLALVGRRLLERAAAIHMTAEGEKVQSAMWFPKGKPRVIPCLFDLQPYQELPGAGPALQKFAAHFPETGVPVILFLSRLHPKKGLEVLIRAAARLRESGLRFRILVAGSGDPAYEDRLKTLVADAGLLDHIRFVGYVSGVDKVSLQEASDLFVLPTSQENWGYVLLESLVCGTPVMTTRGVDIWPELKDSGAALIVEQNAESIATGIREYFENDSARVSMCKAARPWALAALSPQAVLARYEAMYTDALNRGVPGITPPPLDPC